MGPEGSHGGSGMSTKLDQGGRVGRPPSVLLVEDEPALRWMYARRLRSDGLDVLTADDGPQALAAAASRPRLILLDLRLPRMSGLDVLRRLKGDAGTASGPVVMVACVR